MISLIVGLGNPGVDCSGTRHNIGFDVVEKVRQELKAARQPRGETYEWAVCERENRQIVLAWPTTHMNRSGMAVQALLADLGIAPANMLVVLDDIHLPLGRLRLRTGGSDGGHNGLVSIIEALGIEEFPRLRLGIGPVPEGVDMVDFVLSHCTADEVEPTKKMIATAAEAVLYALEHRLDEAMTKYNVNPA
jgi:PTH1 family peptidyl-tRNA hydrolase